MGKFIISLFIIILIILGGYYFYTKSGNSFDLSSISFTKNTIDISSQEFLNGKYIPMKYTCDWNNVNPPLIIDRVPGDAKSVTLIVEDIDAPNGKFTHWLVYNIAPETTNIEEDKVPDAFIGKNDFGVEEYSGPCPPVGAVHKYYFRIYALDTVLSLPSGATRMDIEKAIKGHVIGRGELFGNYLRVAN